MTHSRGVETLGELALDEFPDAGVIDLARAQSTKEGAQVLSLSQNHAKIFVTSLIDAACVDARRPASFRATSRFSIRASQRRPRRKAAGKRAWEARLSALLIGFHPHASKPLLA